MSGKNETIQDNFESLIIAHNLLENIISNLIYAKIEKSPNNFHVRKIAAIQAEVLSQFNQENLGNSLKRHYSKIEREKLLLSDSKSPVFQRKSMTQISSEVLTPTNLNGFCEDIKIHKQKILNEQCSQNLDAKFYEVMTQPIQQTSKRFKDEQENNSRKSSLTDNVIIKKSKLEIEKEEHFRIIQAEAEIKMKEKSAQNKGFIIKVDDLPKILYNFVVVLGSFYIKISELEPVNEKDENVPIKTPNTREFKKRKIYSSSKSLSFF